MVWDSRNGKRFWLGKHEQLGTLLIPEVFLRERPDVVPAFVVKDCRVDSFKASVLRTKIQPGGLSQKDIELAFASLSSISSNMEFNGLTPLANSGASQERVTHCFACRKSLQGLQHIACARCKWLKCSCGACGCYR